MFKKLFKFVTVGFVTFSPLVTVVACNNISSDKQKIIADKKDETKEPDENKKTLTEQYEDFANEIFNEILNTFDKQEVYDQDNNLKEITEYQMDITPDWNNSDKKTYFNGAFTIFPKNERELNWGEIGGKGYYYKNGCWILCNEKNKVFFHYIVRLKHPFYEQIARKISIPYKDSVHYFSNMIRDTNYKLAFFKKELNGFLIPRFYLSEFNRNDFDKDIPQNELRDGKIPLKLNNLNKVKISISLAYLGISEKIVTNAKIIGIRSNEFKSEDNIYGYGYYINDFFYKKIQNVKFMWDTTNCEWCFN